MNWYTIEKTWAKRADAAHQKACVVIKADNPAQALELARREGLPWLLMDDWGTATEAYEKYEIVGVTTRKPSWGARD